MGRQVEKKNNLKINLYTTLYISVYYSDDDMTSAMCYSIQRCAESIMEVHKVDCVKNGAGKSVRYL